MCVCMCACVVLGAKALFDTIILFAILNESGSDYL